MKYTAGDLDYKGEESGVHNWITKQGKSFYWHPDWLHIAEDQTGLHAKQQLDIVGDEKGTKDHAVLAILKHLNDWMVDEIDKHPEVKNEPKL
ncbi:hypothetical protein BIZ37_22535 [Photobacterium sp. BZF1]|uniref:hypothetical protein n=1 Tax=Photobacterium sp. BZF1 TaxID=1904457 RepID=UPI0016536DC2|nr:hypothetical protein [Photobacterium sp. BZF1]MBC7005351.1 hypothetical protein [Photobacterium sp. BZF1]